MKSKREQRRDAICRLKDYFNQPRGYYRNVAHAILGDRYLDITGETCIRSIIDLLTDDDPSADEYIKLPRDENGEVIHLYDALAGYGYPDGGVVCKAIANGQMILVGRITDTYREWLLWDAYKCHHYKKPTVEDVLREFGDEVQRCCDTEDTIAEYAKKLQLREEGCE